MDTKKIWKEIEKIKQALLKRRSPGEDEDTSESSISPPPKKRRILVISSDSSEDEQDDVTNNVAVRTDDTYDLDSILGEDPTISNEFGDEIHAHIAIRWENIQQKGLKKDHRSELLKMHLPPINCTFILPPILNDEIKAAVNDSAVKRDKKLEEKQAQLGAGISCIGKAIDVALQIPDKNLRDQMVKHLSNSGKILTDLHHLESLTRRSLLLQGLTKMTKEVIKEIPRDKYLFGQCLAEKLRAMKACSKSATELKIRPTKQSSLVTQRTKTTARTNHIASLNWQGSSRRIPNMTVEHNNAMPRVYRERRSAPVTSRRTQASQIQPRFKR